MAQDTEDYWIQSSKFPTGEGPPPIWLLDKYNTDRHVSLDVFNAAGNAISIPDLGKSPYNMNDDIDYVIVPPYTTLNVWNRGDYTGAYTKNFDKPGFYRMNDYGLLNAIGSVKATSTQPWSDAMIPCCTSKIEGKWCGAWNPNWSGSVCDAKMKEWCSKAENKDKQECACINSSIKYLPSCFDTKCTNNPLAYKTKDMKSVVAAGCPDIMECNQYIALSDEAKQNLVNRTQMEQNCTSVRNNTTTTQTNTIPTPAYRTNNNQPAGTTNTNPYVPTGSTDPYTPPSSYPYAGSTQPNAYNNPYGGGNYSSNTPFNTSSSTGDDSGKIMGMDPMVLLIIIVVAFAFIVAMYMFFNRNQNNQGYFDQNPNPMNQGQSNWNLNNQGQYQPQGYTNWNQNPTYQPGQVL
jgi:hypothetical protein